MRNRYLDLLRFLAIVRVVVYHVTGWAALTLVFPAMAVMFALAGSLMAASLDRSGPVAVARRLRRLLPSLWVVAAIFVPAMLLSGLPASWRLVLWLLPVDDPPTNDWGGITLSIVWYLRDYLWFVLASPVALWLFRRAALPTLLAPYVLLAVIELGGLPAPLPLREFGLYFGVWMVGFAHHDGMLRRLSRRVLVPFAGALAALGGGWIITHPGSRGFDINDIHLGNALWSAAFVLILLGFAPARAAWVDRNALFSRVVTVFNRRALTIYLWHMTFVAALTPLVYVFGWSHTDLFGLAVRVAGVFALLAVVTVLFGWVEDLAARRRPALLPGSPGENPPAVPGPPAQDDAPAENPPAGPGSPASGSPVATSRGRRSPGPRRPSDARTPAMVADRATRWRSGTCGRWPPHPSASAPGADPA